MILRGAIGIALAVLLIYGLIEAYPLLIGPEIILSSPTEGTTSPTGFVTVSGVAKHTEGLTVNGGPLLIDEKGNFSKELLFPSGASILSLTARDRFGRTVTEERAVYVP